MLSHASGYTGSEERGRASVASDIGIIQTVVGTGEGGYAGDGGPAIQALIGEAYGCDFDTAGNLYISDGRNHTIRRIDRETGIITTVAGCGRQGYSGDGGPATEATLEQSLLATGGYQRRHLHCRPLERRHP